MSLSLPMTIIGITNGMIGGSILVLPLLALQTGYTLIAPITVLSGFMSLYSCLLCLRHLSHFKDLDDAVLFHFDNKRQFKILYDGIIGFSLLVLLIVYFDLITNQWTGLLGKSISIPIINFFLLFFLTLLLKRYNFGSTILAYGIVSIVAYITFLTWTTIEAPRGINEYPPTSPHFIELAAALGQGFAIQTFFIPILKQYPHTAHYKQILFLTYAIGTLIYLFISYTGAYSILNRTPTPHAQTIEDYFKHGKWEVMLIQIIYLVHLYSTFPEFLIVLKHRVIGMVEFSREGVAQVLVFGGVLLISLGVQLSGLSIVTLIELNGAVVSFMFIYLIPIALHLKCLYFTPRQKQLNEEKELPPIQVQNPNNQDNHINNQHNHIRNQHNYINNQHNHINNQHNHIRNQHNYINNQHNHINNQHNHINNQDNHINNQDNHIKNQDNNIKDQNLIRDEVFVEANNSAERSIVKENDKNGGKCQCKYESKIQEIGQNLWITFMLCAGIYIMIESVIIM